MRLWARRVERIHRNRDRQSFEGLTLTEKARSNLAKVFEADYRVLAGLCRFKKLPERKKAGPPCRRSSAQHPADAPPILSSNGFESRHPISRGCQEGCFGCGDVCRLSALPKVD